VFAKSEGAVMPGASRHRALRAEPRPILGVAPSCILCTPRGTCMTIWFRSFVHKLWHRTALSVVENMYESCAGPQRRNLDECYFHRLSNCSIANLPLDRARGYSSRTQQHSVKVGALILKLQILQLPDALPWVNLRDQQMFSWNVRTIVCGLAAQTSIQHECRAAPEALVS